MAACSDDDAGPTQARGVVMGVFRDAEGNPIASTPIKVFLSDTANTVDVEARTLTTTATGQFTTTFDLSPSTFPVEVQLWAVPPTGSGMSDIFLRDSVLALSPGRIADTLTYDLTAVQLEPSVIGMPAVSFAQAALLGRYFGQTVPPVFEQVYVVYFNLEFTGTTGSVSGRYDVDYSGTFASPPGTVLGAVLLDTLRLQLISDTIPGEARHVASFKATATSASADTLIAWPDPCSADCWIGQAPLRIVRVP